MNRKDKTVYIWLGLGLIMVIVQALLGGITRLSGSGLSITEWEVVTGALPPLNHEAWLVEFEKYKASPQFQLLNFDFTLQDFKFIFFWEWFHRFWARLIGVIFIIPFIYFVIKKYFRKDWVFPLIILFLLGALQGMVGWIMVQSGLVGDATYVKPTRLAIHFVLAMVLGIYILWLMMRLKYEDNFIFSSTSLFKFWSVILVIIFIQFIYGALLAGHKSATAAPTWPTINGEWIPTNMANDADGHPFLNNKITIHFIHRTLAYLIFIAIVIISFFRIEKIKLTSDYKKWGKIPLFLVVIQLLLGIFSLLSSTGIIPNQWGTFETLALLHQLNGMVLMLSVGITAYLSGVHSVHNN